MQQGLTTLVWKSIIYHIRNGLAEKGWLNPDRWVMPGYIDPDMRPPNIAISFPTYVKESFEVGNPKGMNIYFIDIDIRGTDTNNMSDLQDHVSDLLTNIPLIDFNIAEIDDPLFSETEQMICRLRAVSPLRSEVYDQLDNWVHLTVRLKPSMLY